MMAFRCLVIGICALLFSMRESGDTAELTKLPVGILLSGELGPTYIAQRKGFFEKNGLAVELMYFQGGSQVIQAMLA